MEASVSEAIDRLDRELQRHSGDASAIEAAFDTHVRSGFLTRFICEELRSIAADADHVVKKNAGNVSFTLLKTERFDYTIRLVAPFAGRPHSVKWLGEPQLLSVSAGGGITVRILRAADDINRFIPEFQIEQVSTRIVDRGSILRSEDSRCILDVYEATSPAILEVLTLHDDRVALHWTFDENLRAAFAESARMAGSRVRNILELAIKMRTPVPEPVYRTILEQGDPPAKLLAIQALLITDSASGFRELGSAMGSADPTLAEGAQQLFDAMLARV